MINKHIPNCHIWLRPQSSYLFKWSATGIPLSKKNIMVVVWPWLFSGLKEKQSCRCNCWLSGVSSTTQKNNAFRARILNSSEVSGKYYLPLSSLRDKIADLEFVFWPVFETLTEINHFMDPCVLYSIPFPLSVRLSGEYFTLSWVNNRLLSSVGGTCL